MSKTEAQKRLWEIHKKIIEVDKFPNMSFQDREEIEKRLFEEKAKLTAILDN